MADAFPDPLPDASRSHFCYTRTVEETTGQIYSDQTGRLFTASSNGNNYIMIIYDYDSNYIMPIPMKSRLAASIILDAYKIGHAQLCKGGLKEPKMQRLVNEASAVLKQFMESEQVDYQLVPPAECAIRTFKKNHFIAGLCSANPKFPLHLWDRLLPQAELTLNLLWGSRINPKLSAWTTLHHGTFDFNRTPIAPPGIQVLVHAKPTQCTTWAPHTLDGWYVGPALESYRCCTVRMLGTQALQIADTVTWMPTKIGMPTPSSTDMLVAALRDIAHALKHPSVNPPLAPLTSSHCANLRTLMAVIHGTLPSVELPPVMASSPAAVTPLPQ